MWIQFKNQLVYVTRVVIFQGEPWDNTLIGYYGDETYAIKKYDSYQEAHDALVCLMPGMVNVIT